MDERSCAAAGENLRMGSLLVITGPPGAGKSTVAALVAAHSNPSVLVEGDAFFAFLDQGAIAPWLPESHSQNDVVTRAAAAATGRFAATYDTVYDGVIGPWFLPTFAAETGLETLNYVILLPTVDECVSRVLTRSGHGFRDDSAARKMHEEFSRAEVDERFVVRDPVAGAEVVAREVQRRAEAGSLVYDPTATRVP